MTPKTTPMLVIMFQVHPLWWRLDLGATADDGALVGISIGPFTLLVAYADEVEVDE